MGLSDDCQELQTIRNFRDTCIKILPGGSQLIAEYYEIAPRILQKIDDSPNAQQVYSWLYDDLVRPVFRSIQSGYRDKAVSHYRNIVVRLKKAYPKSESH